MSSARPAGSLVVLACLTGSLAIPGRSARAEDTWPELQARLLDEGQTVWPGLAREDKFRDLARAVGMTRVEIRRNQRTMKDLTSEQSRLLDACSDDLLKLDAALTAAEPARDDAARLIDDLQQLAEDGVPHLLEELVDQTSGKPEEQVRARFAAVQKVVAEERGRRKQSLARIEAGLDAAVAWHARMSLYAPLDAQLGSLGQKLKHEAQDVFDRVFEQDPAVQAALAGEKSDLFPLCVRGRTEEARQFLRTWRPPRLATLELLKVLALPPEPGWVDIDAHGSGDSMDIECPDGRTFPADCDAVFEWLKRKLGAEDLRNWQDLHDRPGSGFKGFRLVSCQTGQKPFGIAQRLANRLGVNVLAPTMSILPIRVDGTIQGIIHDCPVCDRLKDQAFLDHVVRSRTRGAWKLFTPGTTEASKQLRDKLYELAKKKPWWQLTVSGVKLAKPMPEAIKALRHMGMKGTDAQLEALLKGDDDFVLVAAIPRDAALDKGFEAGRLGLKTRIETLPSFKEYFKNVKTN